MVADLFLPEMSSTTVPVFVDTNVLVYAEDRNAGIKHTAARDLVADLWRSGEGVLSVQVLQEFFVTVTRKMPQPLRPDEALAIVEQYLTWRVVENTGAYFSGLSAWRRQSKSRSGMPLFSKRRVWSIATDYGPRI